MELAENWLDELAHRIHFATFAAGEITLHYAYRALFVFEKSERTHSFRDSYFTTLAPFCQAFIQKIARSY